jgi:hypothetical protein
VNFSNKHPKLGQPKNDKMMNNLSFFFIRMLPKDYMFYGLKLVTKKNRRNHGNVRSKIRIANIIIILLIEEFLFFQSNAPTRLIKASPNTNAHPQRKKKSQFFDLISNILFIGR